jgi:hypothetical protein
MPVLPIVPKIPTIVRDSLAVVPWPDPVIESLGHDARSPYVEQFWLGILGPSTTWLLRRIVAGFETAPEGLDLPLRDTARCLGLGDKGGKHSPFIRSMRRLVQFNLARTHGEHTLAVRRMVPPLNQRQVGRLPRSLQGEHRAFLDAELQRPRHDWQRHRSRQLALSLLELGEELEPAEQQLLRWGFPTAVAAEAVSWAGTRHPAAVGFEEQRSSGG